MERTNLEQLQVHFPLAQFNVADDSYHFESNHHKFEIQWLGEGEKFVLIEFVYYRESNASPSYFDEIEHCLGTFPQCLDKALEINKNP